VTRWELPATEPGLRAASALFALHLLFSWAIAISNVLLGLALLALLLPESRLRPLAESARPPFRLAIAYLLLLVAAIAASIDPATSLRDGSEIFSFATFFLTLYLVRTEVRLRWLVDSLLIVGGLLAMWGLAQQLWGYGELDRRIRGPYSHYMTFSGVLLMLDMLLVARLLERSRSVGARGPSAWLDRPWVAWPIFLLMTSALFASLTRGAWVALAAAVLLVVSRRRPRLLVLAPLAVAAFVVVAPVPVVARLLSIADPTDSSNYDRVCMVEAGLRMVGERPLLGVGPSQVRKVYPVYRHPTAPRVWVPHLHDSYLEIAAERGIPALSVFFAMILTGVIAAERGLRRGGGLADLYLGILGALAAFAIAALFENNWGDTEVQRLALFLLAAPFCLERSGAETA